LGQATFVNALKASKTKQPCQAPKNEQNRTESTVAHENLQGLRRQKRSDSDEMQKMPQQKPQMEEERTSKVISYFTAFLSTFPC
jgi:hypothetical protein